ncbi:MAG: hypothetical protein AB7F78_00085 [Hyphomicrobiaceae bacterium]
MRPSNLAQRLDQAISAKVQARVNLECTPSNFGRELYGDTAALAPILSSQRSRWRVLPARDLLDGVLDGKVALGKNR